MLHLTSRRFCFCFDCMGFYFKYTRLHFNFSNSFQNCMLTNGLLVLLEKKKPNLIQLVVILSCDFSCSFMICYQSVKSKPARKDRSRMWFVFEGYQPEMSKKIRCFLHLSALFSSLWYPLSKCSPTSNLTEPGGGLLMDVEGCSGPTAINSSPARSCLSG